MDTSAAMTAEELTRRAIDGDRDALDTLVKSLQGDVYRLAVRMLWNRQDAEDATQEILVRIVTRLSHFDFRSRVRTWVYRIAVNYLLDVKKSPVERMHMTFAQFADDLATGLSDEGPSETERSVLIDEVKIGCTLGMLQCLDRPHRLAYVLGEILELTGPEAAAVLDITPALFRKRLQHAREEILAFTREHCGLVSDAGYQPVDLGDVATCAVMEAPRRPGAVYGEEWRLPEAEHVRAAVAAGRPIPPTPVYPS